MTAETSTNGAMTLFRINISEYVGHMSKQSAGRLLHSYGYGLQLDSVFTWLAVTHLYRVVQKTDTHFFYNFGN